MSRAIEAGFVQAAIQKAAYECQRAVEKKQQIVVGGNDFVAPSTGENEGRAIPILRIDAEIERSPIARPNALRAKRDSARAQPTPPKLTRRPPTTEEPPPPTLAAVEAHATA